MRIFPIVAPAGSPVGEPAVDEADRQVEALTALAVAAFGRRDRALRWLHRPRPEFGGLAPLEMLETPAAARQVETMLRQMLAERSEP